MSLTRGVLRPLRVLRRASASLADAATITTGLVRSIGYTRVRVVIVMANGMAPAAGYPRVRWSVNGTSFITRTLAVDPTQAPLVAYVYEGDVEGDYMIVDLVNSAVVGNVYAWVTLVPGGA